VKRGLGCALIPIPTSGDESEMRKGLKVGPRRPRRRYNRNVELVLGIVVIVIVIVLLVRVLG
jgi:hypothetical protein